MSKTIQEQIEVMQHYANGGDVEYLDSDMDWKNSIAPLWNWGVSDYRIKEQKEKTTITIEKWLLKNNGVYKVFECNNKRLNTLTSWIKVKLLDSYEVQI